MDKIMFIPFSCLLENLICNIFQKHREMAFLFCIIKELHSLTQIKYKHS